MNGEPSPVQASPWSVAIPVGVAMTAAMWSAGYICRLPFVMAPPWLIFFSLLAILIGGGRWSAARSPRRVLTASIAGAFAGTVNLLILGSWLVEGLDSSPSALKLTASVVAFVLGCTALSALGALTRGPGSSTEPMGIQTLTRSAFWTTLMLVGIGGLVTSEEAGMAVPDWPASFGNNMFLLPLSRMTGGIYYEHAHRLFATLVGLVTITMAFYIWRVDRRVNFARWGLFAIVLVVVQGVLGGLRVLSGGVDDSSPSSLLLRVVHGMSGQIFLAVLAIIAALGSIRWATEPKQSLPLRHRRMALATMVAFVLQLVLGALTRHVSRDWLIPHLVFAFLVVALAMGSGALLAADPQAGTRRRLALSMVIACLFQLTLGFMVLAVTGSEVRSASSGVTETLMATSHQSLGAIILSLSAILYCWSCRVPERLGEAGQGS